MKSKIFASIATLSVCLLPVLAHAQAVPTGIQEYYLIGHSEQLYEMLQEISEPAQPAGENCGLLPGASTNERGMNVVTTLTATTDIQQVIYDHWEDGYEADPLNPVFPGTTLVLGDDNPANGHADDFTTATLASDLISTDIALRWVSSDDTAAPATIDDYVPYPRPTTPLELRYDAPDRIIIIGGPVNLVHTMEPRLQHQGGATTVYPRQILGTNSEYLIPIGIDLYDGNNGHFEPFKHVYLQLVSYDDSTTITVDNGTDTPITFQLDEGRTWSSRGKRDLTDIPSSQLDILAGTRVTADGAVAALLVTGGYGCWALRLYSLLPEQLFGTDYVTPVYGDADGTNGDREQNIYLYNPHDTALAVDVYDGGAGGTMSVPARGIAAYTQGPPTGLGMAVPQGNTARLVSDRHFWGVAAAHYHGTGSDWGFGLVPTGMLVDAGAMSWAPGNADSPPLSSPNVNPIWVSPLMDGTEVQVDLDGNGTFEQADIDGDGAPDPFTGPIGYLVNALETLRIFDHTDHDQTGARIKASNRVSMAYGQDTETAPGGGQALDLGYEILPQDQRFLEEVLSVTLTADRTVISTVGGDINFTIEVRSFDSAPVTAIDATHVLPSPWTLNSAVTVNPAGGGSYTATTISTPVPGGTLLSWDLDEALNAAEIFTITFAAAIAGGSGTDGRYDHEAAASGVYDGRTYSPRDELAIIKAPLRLDLTVDSPTARPGESLTYTATVTNTGTSNLDGVQVRIPVPFDTFLPAPLPPTYDGDCSCVVFTATGPPAGRLGPGDSEIFAITVQISVDAPIDAVIFNEARAISSSIPQEIISQSVSTLVRAPDLVATLSAQAFTFDNWIYPYTVQLTNVGTEDATGAVITMNMPANTTYDPASMEISINGAPFAPLSDANDADVGRLISGTPDQVRVDLASLATTDTVVFRFDVQTDAPLADGTPIIGVAQVDSNETFLESSNTVTTTVDNSGDADGDGLTNTDESNATGPLAVIGVGPTDPFDRDTDDDGIDDGDEVLGTGPLAPYGWTDPNDWDTDNDAIFDGTEAGVFNVPSPDTDTAAGHFRSDADTGSTTDPTDPDTDSGGVSDGVEDADRNGRVDAGETDPNDFDDDDPDLDGLSNAVEIAAGTDRLDADSDDDGVLDGAELAWDQDTDGDTFINALDEDSDADGILDGTEMQVVAADLTVDTDTSAGNFRQDDDPSTGTSMLTADTDSDGLWDGTEDADANGRVDSGETDPNNPDTDGDGSDDAADCAPLDSARYPGASETPVDGIDQDCDGVDACYQDLDLDGFGTSTLVDDTNLDCSDGPAGVSALDTDCDDSSMVTFPGAAPNDSVSECMRDADNDDWGDASAGAPVVPGSDCNDSVATIHPTASEIADDGIDQDCNGFDTITCTVDADNDGDGTTAGTPVLASDGSCDAAQGESATATDCDDADPTIYAGAPELCDGNDNDCDSLVPAVELDEDSDTWVACAPWDDTQGDQPSIAGGGDCDGDNPAINPGVAEVICNGVDDDCSFVTPDDPNSNDNDLDGFTVNCGNDCDDSNFFVNPSMSENCVDGIDNNCDGLTDGEDTAACPGGCTTDADGDGFPAESCGGSDCDDSNPTINPNEAEDCSDGIDNNCDALVDLADPRCGVCVDGDGDSYEDIACGGSDCDDTRQDINPGAAEICVDNIDNDCDGLIDNADAPDCSPTCDDIDSDGYDDMACGGTDCDDRRPAVHPGAGEDCFNGLDDDCDGATDDADPDCPAGCQDADGDGHLDEACGGTDCDDSDATIRPNQVEECTDSVDNDCDGLIDGEDEVDCPGGCTDDVDGDGYPDIACGGSDCDDTSFFVNPAAGEECTNGIDDNCDSLIDFDDTLSCPGGCLLADVDGDGYLDVACGGTDCDDTDPLVHPGAAENCTNGVDDNCDGVVDSDDEIDCPAGCADADGDGYMDIGCGGTDCNDGDAAISPGELEIDCNGIDDDCDVNTPDEPDHDRDDYVADWCAPGDDCADDLALVNPGAGESCDDAIDNNCDGLVDASDPLCPLGCADADGDSYADDACGGSDCDDSDPNRHLGAGEHCTDGLDNDCDSLVDDADTGDCPPGCLDFDGDGYRAAVCGGTDCDDTRFDVYPGAGEHCSDGVDNNCNGRVDEADVECPAGCADADLDGYRDAACGGSDCNDVDAEVRPGAGEQCSDGIDNNCDGRTDGDDPFCPGGCTDSDGDGYGDIACGGSDCDDGDAAVSPGSLEICNDGVDNNCNGLADEDDPFCPAGCDDADSDGFFDLGCGGQDCDDSNRRINPDAGESCDNGVDDNCNSLADADDPLCSALCPDEDADGYRALACGGSDCDDSRADVRPGSSEDCFDSIDNDCDDRIDAEDVADCPPDCVATDADSDGYPSTACGGSDCDDDLADVNPAQFEILCNDRDDDCDPSSPDDPDPSDADNDGYTVGCGPDCDDANPYIGPSMPERCDDTLDNNCDGLVDAGDTVTCPSGCPDADGDGYLDAACGGSDCDDSNYHANPGAGEHCSDGVDNDCSGLTDGDDLLCRASCADADEDGYRDISCGGSDCDDSDASVHPGAGEYCTDGVENDCNGLTDEADIGGCPPGCADADSDGYPAVECGGSDCDDTFEETHPSSVEICDGADNDCNGVADEGAEDSDNDGLADCVDPDADGDGWVDAALLSGGGCYCDNAGRPHGSRAGLWLLLLAIPPLLRRRERWAAMSRAGAAARRLAILAPFLAILLVGTLAFAQGREPRNFTLERLRPAMDGAGVIDTNWADVPEHMAWEGAFWLGYANEPLVLNIEQADQVDRVASLVGHRVGGSLIGSVGLFGWLQAGAELPVILYQERGQALEDYNSNVRSLSAAGTGDLRLSLKARIWSAKTRPFDLAVIPAISFPVASAQRSYFGERRMTLAPEIAVSRKIAMVRVAANLGYRFRTRTRTVNLIVDDEITYRAAVAYDFAPMLGVPLEAATGMSGSTGSKVPFRKVPRNPLELYVGATYKVSPMMDAFAGGGAGVIAGYSTPDFRLYAGVRFAPPDEVPPPPPPPAPSPEDSDGDGLLDPVDSCPTEPEDRDAFADEDGCPDPDNDSDGVLDTNDRCPLEAEDKDGFEDENGCPDPDNDSDLILDVDDKCPMAAESVNNWEDEDGCPEDIPDTDGDGLFDDTDKCVKEPEDKDQFEDADGCPDPDNDADGVADVADACPLQPGVMENGGCPDSDRDGDQVVDRLDVCPDEPGDAEFSGCAKKQLVKLSSDKIEILEKVFFDSGKDTIKKVSFQLLDSVAKVLSEHLEIQKVRIEGHTDSQGSRGFNKDLSERRAASVVTYLINRGVAADRLVSQGLGEGRPIATNNTAQGRATNRRVEFHIVRETGR